MNSKALLYSGFGILFIGILMRYLSPYPMFGLVLIISGVLLKLIYIAVVIIKGRYKPGKEFLLLIIGLLFLFLGLWHKLNVSTMVGYSMVSVAVILKVIFIILFIKKTKAIEELQTP
jgi:hypothetical protein